MSPPIKKSVVNVNKSNIIKIQSFPDIFPSYESELRSVSKVQKSEIPRKLASINSLSTLNISNNNDSKVKKITVGRLVKRNEYPESKTNRDYSYFNSNTMLPKWNQLTQLNLNILSTINLKTLESLKNSIENAKNDCLAHTNISEIAKISLIDMIFEIFQNFHACSEEILKMKTIFEEKVHNLQKENTKLVEDLKFQLSTTESTKVVKHNKKKISKKPEFNQTKYEIEKLQLIEKISILETHLLEAKNYNKTEDLLQKIEKYKELYEKSEQNIETLKAQNKNLSYRCQQEIGDIKNKASEDRAFVIKFLNYSANYQHTIDELEKKVKEVEDKERLAIERFCMVSEDFVKYESYRVKYWKTNEKLKIMKLKYNQLELELIDGSSVKVNNPIDWVSTKDPIFDKVSSGYIKEESNFVSIDIVNTAEFKLNCPSFAGLLDVEEEKYSYKQDYSNWLEVNIRGIFDCKFCEHLLCGLESGRPPTNFPEFVYGWIGKFCIDDITRSVTELEEFDKEKADFLRIKFLLALKQSNTNKIWEVYTFKEFLNEELLIDELTFYLQCRNLLFKGPQLALTQGKYSSLHYVDMTLLTELMDSLMPKLSLKEIKDLKNQLYSKIKPQTNSIDSGFVIIM